MGERKKKRAPPDLFPITKPREKPATREESDEIGRAGDLARLVERNYWFIWGMASRWATHSALPFEDLFQDACERILHRGHNFNPDKGTFTTYFQRALKKWFGNRELMWKTGRQNHTRYKIPACTHGSLEKVIDILEDENHGHDPIEVASDAEIAELVWRAIDELDERRRRVIIARFFDNKTLRSIAEEMGVSKQRVSQIENEALKILRTSEPLWPLRP